MSYLSRLVLAAGSAIALFAQAPASLTVKSATSKQVTLTWSGSASSYTVQRAVLGGSFATIGTAAATTYTDSSIDPYTTYQYQVLNGTAASSPVTAGPPPSGFTVAAPAPTQGNLPNNYGYDLTTTLDANGDPAFAFVFADPNDDSDESDTEVMFRSWNRAQYQWNPVVKVATAGDIATTFHYSISLAHDSSSGTWGIASETNQGQSVVLYTSTDGVSWTLKRSFSTSGQSTFGPSLALANGNLYLAYVVGEQGLKYVTGKLTDTPANWTITTAPKVSGVNIAISDVAPSLALDANGSPGIAYWCGDPNQDYNQILLYWRPGTTAAPVRVLDTQNHQSGVAVRLRYAGLNPRIAFYALRSDAQESSGDGDQFTRSDDGGATWPAANIAPIPADGTSSTDFPFDMALTSQGGAAFVFGQNSGTGDAVCGNPKVARSTDLVHWTTCAADKVNVTGAFGPYPGAIRAEFGGNDKLYMFWWESGDNGVGQGILMYREPPATAVSAPAIASVVNNATNQPGIVAGSWVTIYGANLAGSTTRWDNYISGTTLPTTINGVQVKINGLLSAIYYISPSQINVQAPEGISGSATVQVINNGVAGNTVTATASKVAPGLFSYLYPATNKELYPAAVFNSTGVVVGDPTQVPGTAKARAGDIIQLYATGLGPSPAGVTIGTPVVFQDPITVTIGTANAQVLGTALTYPGEFQVNIAVPQLAPGDYPITLTVDGQTSQAGVYLPVTQ